jgi:type VI secretion system secreted protein Hcp
MTRSLVLSRTRLLAVAVAAVFLALVAWQLAGPRTATTNVGAAAGIVHMTMKVTGHKQGAFKGDDVTSAKDKSLITVIGYSYEIVSPRDASSGLPTGKRQHKPVTITHELGGSSPQFLAAAASNEVLDSVVISFFRTDRTGKESLYYRVTLTNGSVSDVRQYSAGNSVLEDVAFTFQKIEQEDITAKTTFIDDWSSNVS